ncbi:hypothetical protein ANCDUO_04864 [Ancylostoma duodenale]|uniref:Ankyrin repeat protein n=1 Tax=Ancylostoma duodenale TaxID=51022 RepID=A0A0C2H5W0_9BILA|nr:hypothetical protein ANCDUO_04864 [Ancylostoma duodenale]
MNGTGGVVQVMTKSAEPCAPPTSTVEMEDPFDDPALVTNAFLDIMWQDSHGNSALMLAAAENRILHVKGILTMAVERGTLWQMLEMRNEDGLTALEMAVRAGSDTCATLITKFARDAQKSRDYSDFIIFYHLLTFWLNHKWLDRKTDGLGAPCDWAL